MKKFLKIPIEKIATTLSVGVFCPGEIVDGEQMNTDCGGIECRDCTKDFIEKYTVEEED